MIRLWICLLLLAGASALPVRAADVDLDAVRRAELARLPSLRGPTVRDADLKDRIVVVTFFASWCPPCHQEFQELKRLEAEYRGRGLSIVAVNLFEDWGNLSDPRRLDAFLARHDPAFAVVRGDGETGALFGGVSRIPTLFVFGPDGRPRLHFVHARGADRTFVGYDDLKIIIDSLSIMLDNTR